MARIHDFIHDHRGMIMVAGPVAIAVIALSVWYLAVDSRPESTAATERRYSVKVKRVYSGQAVKLKKGGRLSYAGIRTPYKVEPFHEEAHQRNSELVRDQKIRLRFDEHADRNADHLRAYAFTKDGFINEILVSEGLAYVRVTPSESRFAKRLLAAQKEARRKGRGLWKRRAESKAGRYPSDPKYGNFHGPKCEEVGKIKPDRLKVFRTIREAVGHGFAPCSKCLPLE